MKKTAIATALTGATLLLSACHDNPLTRADSKKTADFLVKASKYAEQHSNRMADGKGYPDCMGDNLAHFNCNKIFAGMQAYAKSSQDFKNLTVADLKSRDAYKKLAGDYHTALMDSY